MEKKLTAPTIVEQKAIIRDCLEKTAYIRQTMARLFPSITLDKDPGYSIAEDWALDIYEDFTVSIFNSLTKIYGHLIGKEVSHE